MLMFLLKPADAEPDLYRIQGDSGDIDRRVCTVKHGSISPKVNTSDPNELLPPR